MSFKFNIHGTSSIMIDLVNISTKNDIFLNRVGVELISTAEQRGLVPYREGYLERSARMEGTKITYNTDYARKMYTSKNYHFTRSTAQDHWIERLANEKNKMDVILKNSAKKTGWL